MTTHVRPSLPVEANLYCHFNLELSYLNHKIHYRNNALHNIDPTVYWFVVTLDTMSLQSIWDNRRRNIRHRTPRSYDCRTTGD